MLNRKNTPRIKDAVEFDLRLKPYEKLSLQNGTDVYMINAGAEDVMMIELVYYAGNSYDDKNVVAAATNFLLKNGTSKHTAFQINEQFEYHGAYLNRACYNETASITLHCLTKHFDQLLPMVQEILNDSIFPEEEIAIFRQNSKQRLSVNLKKCDFVANRLIDKYLYGPEHPYGRVGNAEDYDALNQQDLKDFYSRYYQNGRFIIFAAGRLPANFNSKVEEYFGGLRVNHDLAVPLVQPTPAIEKKYRVENDPLAVQGAIRLGRPVPNRHHPDFQKLMILNNIFGGYFGSRLMSNIREEKGYTYGISSYIQNHIGETSLLVSTEAGKEVCEETIKEIYNEMSSLRETNVDEEELLLVKNYMMGISLGELDGPFHIIARWKNLILKNLDEKYFYETMNTIKSVSANELRGIAEKYLVESDFYELVVT